MHNCTIYIFIQLPPTCKLYVFEPCIVIHKLHTIFINDLMQLYCLRHVSNNQDTMKPHDIM